MLGTPIWPDMRVPGPRLKNPGAIPACVVYSNRIRLSTCIQNASGFTLILRTPQGNGACAMKPSAATLRIDFMVRNGTRSCYIIQIHSRFKNIHSRECIQKVQDSPANLRGTCKQKAYLERKSCGIFLQVLESIVFLVTWD